jgi:hypothetical protein
VADANTRYDDKQVGLILKRATELATDSSPESSPGDGLSLAELEQIAVEAGIDPVLIRRAAQEGSLVGRLVQQIREGNAKRVGEAVDPPLLPPGNG